MKISKTRREVLFRTGKPTIRPAVYEDIRWLWAAARRNGYDGKPDDFTLQAEAMLAEADKLFIAEDRSAEYQAGSGPVGLIVANYDGWALVPHAEWFPWASTRNKLRCTVGFLQSMRYAQNTGVIKIFAHESFADWFKRLRRYLPIHMVGKIPAGRDGGDEYIFYVRGRGKHEQSKLGIRRPETAEPNRRPVGDPAAAGDLA